MLFRFQLRRAVQTLPWPFLATLGLGILAAIALFSTPIRWMLEHRLALILAFFFGLVLASAVAVLPRVKRWSAGRFVALIAGTAAGWLIVGLPLLQNPPDSPFYLILCGAVAICAHKHEAICSGGRAEDMALRLKYAGMPSGGIRIMKDYDELIGELGRMDHNVTVVANYSAMLEFRAKVASALGLAGFWEG